MTPLRMHSGREDGRQLVVKGGEATHRCSRERIESYVEGGLRGYAHGLVMQPSIMMKPAPVTRTTIAPHVTTILIEMHRTQHTGARGPSRRNISHENIVAQS